MFLIIYYLIHYSKNAIINIVRGCMAEQINDKCGLTVKIHYKYHIIEKKVCVI